MILHGQTHGGIAQGVGQALLENSYYEPQSGQLLAASFMDYAIPRADTLPFLATACQQSPAPLGGGLVKTKWFKRYRDSDKPERFDRIVQSWDTANKATELSDYSVCTTWGVKGKHLFLIGLFRRRLEYPALKRAVREQQNLFDASVVLIEDKASGTQLIQDL